MCFCRYLGVDWAQVCGPPGGPPARRPLLPPAPLDPPPVLRPPRTETPWAPQAYSSERAEPRQKLIWTLWYLFGVKQKTSTNKPYSCAITTGGIKQYVKVVYITTKVESNTSVYVVILLVVLLCIQTNSIDLCFYTLSKNISYHQVRTVFLKEPWFGELFQYLNITNWSFTWQLSALFKMCLIQIFFIVFHDGFLLQTILMTCYFFDHNCYTTLMQKLTRFLWHR